MDLQIFQKFYYAVSWSPVKHSSTIFLNMNQSLYNFHMSGTDIVILLIKTSKQANKLIGINLSFFFLPRKQSLPHNPLLEKPSLLLFV